MGKQEKLNTPTRKDFHIGDILSVTTKRLVSLRGPEGLYPILGFMNGGSNPFTMQLGSFADQCKSHLLRQHPQLNEVDSSGVNEHNWKTWLGEQAVKYGYELPVEPLPLKERIIKDPVKELQSEYPDKLIFPVDENDIL